MTRLGLAHPGYGFERHMGYSVPEHFAALAKLGPTIHHRKSFAPVAAKLAAMDGTLGNASDEAVARLLPL
jgi:ribonuclease HII